MEGSILIGFAIFGILLVVCFIVLYSLLISKVNQMQQNQPPDPTILALTTSFQAAEQSSRQSLEKIAEKLGGLAQATQTQQKIESKSFTDIAEKLGALSKATENMLEVGRTITSLENLLKPPKLRGGMGETLLAELLDQILPREHYDVQHSFKSGEKVDAVIKLGTNLVPVDAKFPLENFRKMVETKDKKEAEGFRKVFFKDIKSHIEKISKKYILPDEGTYDFALMYIPAENVYYETIIKDEHEEGLLPFSLENRVIPVSPNSFYAYLEVIIRGLKGLRIEEKAQEILSHLTRLQGDEQKVRDSLDVLGRHLTNAQSKYEETDRNLNRFEDKLLTVSEGNQVPELTAGTNGHT